MSETSATIQEARQAALSRELSEFLVEFSIGVHRHAMYPSGHPSLAPVLENIVRRLAGLFEDRLTLAIGVAQRQLVIEGVATDQKHPVLSDLARRLHGHQLGAISIKKGVTGAEMSGLLETLARESERGGTPLGLLSSDELPAWEHARIHPVGYEKLEIHGDTGEGPEEVDRATALWLGLAQAAMAGDGPVTESPDAGTMARAIEKHGKETAYDQVILGYLLQLSEELKGTRGAEADKVRKRVSRLMNELDDNTLSRLVQFGGNAAQRKRFLLDANQSLAVDSVVKILRAAAASAGQDISNSMTRLLSKLAVHAEDHETHVGPRADTALRENVESLIEGWELKDPNPGAYTALLDEMSRAAPILGSAEDGVEEGLSGAERVVETALEVDAYGPIVSKAVADLIEEGGAGRLLEMIDQSPRGNSVADRIRQHLTNPAQFREILSAGRVDEAALTNLIGQMGSAAVDPLLDVLGESGSRPVRRRVFDALVEMGPWVGQRTVERLSDGRWFVLRNMLTLLQRLDPLPESFNPQPLMEHPDPRVRREALPLALRDPRRRDRALVAALSDEDERMVRMALLVLRGKKVPERVLPTLVNRVVASEERTSEIRALGASTLAGTHSQLALNVLLDIASPGKSIFGRAKLAPNSPELLAVLHALAHGWPDDPQATAVLQMAAHSKDPAIRGAVRAGIAPELMDRFGFGGEE